LHNPYTVVEAMPHLDLEAEEPRRQRRNETVVEKIVTLHPHWKRLCPSSMGENVGMSPEE